MIMNNQTHFETSTRPRCTTTCVNRCESYGLVCPAARHEASKAALKAASSLRRSRKISICMQELIGSSCRKVLGVGGYCTVEQVQYKDKACAMKRLRREVMARKPKFIEGVEDLATEATLLTKLDHENIVKLKGMAAGSIEESVENSEGFFVVMEKLQTTLEYQLDVWTLKRQTMRNRGANLRERIKVALPVAKALQYLHSKNIAHRDIKPANIGFDENGVVKLFDFGIATELKGPQCLRDVAGTIRYMAPEMMLRIPYNQSVDVYAFGILLWQLCSMEKPFKQISTKESFKELVGKGGLRPRIAMWWPRQVKTILSKCWKHQSERPSMDEIVQMLEKAL